MGRRKKKVPKRDEGREREEGNACQRPYWGIIIDGTAGRRAERMRKRAAKQTESGLFSAF